VGERCVAVIEQPCILCEQVQELWHVLVDEEVSIERIVREEQEHTCPGMVRLLRERPASPAALKRRA
jgi:hypothetical protein